MRPNKWQIGENHSHPREIPATSHKFHAAFTMVELLVVLAIVLILVIAILPAGTHDRAKAPRIKCVNNLKNLGLAYHIYATDHNDRFPWELPDSKGTNSATHILYSSDPTTHILAVTNELSTPMIVKCPADTRKSNPTNWTQFTRDNLSYFISPDASETSPQSFIAGDRNITNEFGKLLPGLRTISLTNNTMGWDETIHKNQGNACMGDGSVQQLSTARLREQLRNTGQTNKTIKLAVP